MSDHEKIMTRLAIAGLIAMLEAKDAMDAVTAMRLMAVHMAVQAKQPVDHDDISEMDMLEYMEKTYVGN